MEKQLCSSGRVSGRPGHLPEIPVGRSHKPRHPTASRHPTAAVSPVNHINLTGTPFFSGEWREVDGD